MTSLALVRAATSAVQAGFAKVPSRRLSRAARPADVDSWRASRGDDRIVWMAFMEMSRKSQNSRRPSCALDVGRVVCSGGVVEGRHRDGGDFSAFAGELFAVLDGVSRDRFDVFHRSDEEEAALGRIDG